VDDPPLSCDGACAYTVAFYLGDRIEPPEESLRADVADADEFVYVRHDAAVSQGSTFEVPERASTLNTTFSFHATNESSYTLLDPAGNVQTRRSWEGQARSRQTSYAPTSDPPPASGQSGTRARAPARALGGSTSGTGTIGPVQRHVEA